MLSLSVNIMSYTHGACTYIYSYIYVCSICHFKRLMIAQVYNYIKDSRSELFNSKCNDNYSY